VIDSFIASAHQAAEGELQWSVQLDRVGLNAAHGYTDAALGLARPAPVPAMHAGGLQLLLQQRSVYYDSQGLQCMHTADPWSTAEGAAVQQQKVLGEDQQACASLLEKYLEACKEDSSDPQQLVCWASQQFPGLCVAGGTLRAALLGAEPTTVQLLLTAEGERRLAASAPHGTSVAALLRLAGEQLCAVLSGSEEVARQHGCCEMQCCDVKPTPGRTARAKATAVAPLLRLRMKPARRTLQADSTMVSST
jgi:hypothetical protein